MLHAAGLGTVDGRVHVLVGTSGAGKTTAAGRLCADLFGYVTDELVAIAPDGSVTAYPKPLSVVEPSLGHAKGQYGPDQLGLLPTPEALRSGAFVLLERHPDATLPELRELPLAEALLALLPHTSSIMYLPRPLQVLCRLLVDGGAYRLTYAEIDAAGPLLASLGAPSDKAEWQGEPIPQATPLLWDGLYRRAPLIDAVRVGEEIVALGDGAPVRIMGIGISVWEATESAARLQDLVDTAVAAHGSHPDAQQLVEDATRLLVDAGLLHYERPLSLMDVMAGQSTREDAATSVALP
jgi:GTPase SAR1 family protein